MKRKWRENEEIERKWGENEEMERESFPLHFLILFPFPHSLLISSFSFHFLILCPFPLNFLIFSPFPHSLSISSFSLHFLSISSFSLHFLFISSFSLHFLAARLQGCNDSRSPVCGINLLPIWSLSSGENNIGKSSLAVRKWR